MMHKRLLNLVAIWTNTFPRIVITIAVLLALMGGGLAATRLRVNANTDHLIDANRPFMQRYQAYLDEFGDLRHIYVVVDSKGDSTSAKRCVDELAERMNDIDGVVNVYHRLNVLAQWQLATRSMSNDELASLALARGALPVLADVEISSEQVLQTASNALENALAVDKAVSVEDRKESSALALLLLQEWSEAAGMSKRNVDSRNIPQYLNPNGSDLYLIEVVPTLDFRSLTVIQKPLKSIRSAIDDLRPQYPSLEIGVTGLPAIQTDEMQTSIRDMQRCATVAFAVCAILIVVVLRMVRGPILATIAFACGVGWSIGLTTLMFGELNLLSNVFLLVLIGAGLDYGVHILVRFEEWRRLRPNSLDEAIAATIQTAGTGNITGALTSSLAFFVAWLTPFHGLRELGIIAGVGLLCCMASMTIVLPAMLRVFANLPSSKQNQNNTELLRSPHDPARKHYLVVLLGTIVFSVVLWVWPGQVGFEDNLLELQAEGVESVDWQNRLGGESDASLWAGAIVVDEMSEIQPILDLAKSHPEIGRVQSIFDVIQPPTLGRLSLRNTLLVNTHSNTNRRLVGDHLPVNLKRISASLDKMVLLAHASGLVVEEQSIRSVALAFAEVAASDISVQHDEVTSRLRTASYRWKALIDGNAMPLIDVMPAEIRRHYISKAGRFLIQLSPAKDAWNLEEMQAFTRVLTDVDPNTTGTPFLQVNSLQDMRVSFLRMSIFAVFGIIVLLYVDLRRWADVVVAMLPLGVGVFWMLQLMAALHLEFNVANFFALPIILGLSVDASVHLIHRYREGGEGRFYPIATRKAVVLTGCTTMIGFGSLIFAHHRGLQSLGMVMILGIGCCLIAAMVVLPAALAGREAYQERRSSDRN